MKVTKCTITKAELNVAVEVYLKTQGINLPIESVEQQYSHGGDYVIKFVEPEVKPAPPQPEE